MAKPVQQQQHQRFEDNGDSDSLTAQVAEDVLENLNSSAATGSGSKKGSYDSTSSSSDDSDDDDDAPEAVQVSSARSKERERLAKLQRWVKML